MVRNTHFCGHISSGSRGARAQTDGESEPRAAAATETTNEQTNKNGKVEV
jgi:hypothetical protein